MKKNKNILLVLTLTLAFNFVAFAQIGTIDFESSTVGIDTTNWEVFENDDNPALDIIANPYAQGINTSGKVAKFTARTTGQPYAGCITRNFTPFTLDETNCTVKIMVWKTVISDIGIKFEANQASTGEIKIANTLINQWEEITFDFSGKIGEPSSTNIDGMAIFPDFNSRSSENIIYFDSITFSEKLAQADVPQTAAPTPTVDAVDVISLFSDAYTNVTVDSWSTDWDNADVSDVKIADNDNKLYTNLTFAGIEFATQTVDATDMTHFHIDMWTPNGVSMPAEIKIKFVDFGANGVYGDDDTEHELIFTAETKPGLVSKTWMSFDIQLSEFINLTAKEHLAQLIITATPSTLYLDNIYFYKGEVKPTAPEIPAPTPTVSSDSVISLFSDVYENVLVDTWSTDWDQTDVTTTTINKDSVKLYTNMTFAGIEFKDNTIDISNMTHFHLDFWTPDDVTEPNVFKIKLVDFGADGTYDGGDDTEHEIILNDKSTPALTSGMWNSLDIPLSDFVNLTTKEHLAQFIIAGNPNTVYLDNIYFYGGLTDVEVIDNKIPDAFSIEQNYPNPFNPTTTIRFHLNEADVVKIKIMNVLGEEITTLVNEYKNAGSYKVNFDASSLSSGIYLYSISSGNNFSVKKMLLLK